MKSIRGYFLVSLLSALTIGGIVMGSITYYAAKQEINELFDAHLQDVALLALRQEPSIVTPMTHTEKPGDEDIIVQIWNRKKNLLYHTDQKIIFPYPAQDGFSDMRVQKQNWRIYTGRSGQQAAVAAYSSDDRQDVIEKIVLRILIPLMLLVPILGILVWIGVGRGLVPLTRIGISLKKRAANNLMPLSNQDTPEEIQPVISALNDLFQRLSLSIAAQKKFVADAAHELRTPLTAIKFQLEIAENAQTEKDRRDSMVTLKTGVNRAIHLSQQLLSLARHDPDSSTNPYKPVDLLGLARSSITQLLSFAMAKNIDLGIADADDEFVQGDRESLQIMLNNLLDNAIRYSPKDSRIDIGIKGRNDCIILNVCDNGPGIPYAERGRVFDRFYRISGTSEMGTGLGLAIVKTIVERHGATIELTECSNGPGLEVNIIFPRERLA